MKDNYYHILGLSPSASSSEIKEAYRTLAKKYHPDKNPEDPTLELKFKRINEAYQSLKDPSKKANYDIRLKYGAETRSTQYTSSYQTKNYERYDYPGGRRTGRSRFNKWTIMYGQIFVLALILTVVLTPVLLYYFSSEYNYNKGKEYLEQKAWSSALVHFRRAMVNFGAKNTQAGIQASRIEQTIMNDHIDAIILCNETLEYAQKNNSIAEIYFLRAKSYIEIRNFTHAKKDLEKALKYNSDYDSAHFLLGELNSLVFEDYNEGITNFDQLLEINKNYKNGYFARAYCYQKLGVHEKAIQDFERSIKRNPDNGQAYFFKAISELTLNRIDIACHDLYVAKTIGVKDAEAIMEINCSTISKPDS